MQLFYENETEKEFPFDAEGIAKNVILKTLEVEKCPFAVEVNVLVTDEEGIREYNRNMRNIDSATDVLSFPNLFFDSPSQFHIPEEERADFENPESGLIILGDIVINRQRVFSQAEEYGHSPKREFAFLVAHSMYHLCGYDHMTEGEAAIMEEKQEHILQYLNYTREA